MTPPFNCPGCSRRIAAKGLSHCPACGASFASLADDVEVLEAEENPSSPKKPIKPKSSSESKPVASGAAPSKSGGAKKKAKKKAASKPNWLLIGGGAAGGVALLVLFIWLFSGGKKASFDDGPGGGVSTGTGDYAVVDQLPDAPPPAEVASAPEPEPKKKSSSIFWEVKADLVEKPVDYTDAVGAAGPEQDFLPASNGGHCGIFMPPVSSYAPEKRMKQFLDEKTGAHRQEPLAGTPFSVVDVLSGKALGDFKVDLVSIWHRLSKDGTYLAGYETKAVPGRYDFRPDFVVHKRDADQPVLRYKPLDTILWFDFIGETKIALWYGGPASSLVILDIEKGGPVQTVTLPKADGTSNDAKPHPNPQYTTPIMTNGAVSPNGAYVVLGELQRLLIYSPKESRWVGQMKIATPNPHDLELYRALCFDETGSELRALLGYRPRSSLVETELNVWSMPEGQLLHKRLLHFPTLYGHRILTGPSPGTLIVANRVIEVAGGEILEELAYSPIAWAGKDHLVAIAGGGKIVNEKELKATVPYHPYVMVGRVAFDREKFAKAAAPAQEKVRAAGATTTDQYDRSAVARTKTGPTAAWAVKPSQAPPIPDGASSKRWPHFFSASEGGELLDTESTWGRFDLKTGEWVTGATGVIKLGARRQQSLTAPLARPALSLDGRHLAFVAGIEPSRIDVWDNTGKHVTGFRPYGDHPIEWAGWSSKGHLLTARDDRLSGWNIHEKKAVFEAEGNFKSRVLSGGRDWVLLTTLGENLDFVDANTGSHLGRIPGEGPNRVVSVSPDGKTLLRSAPAAPPSTEILMQVWDLTTGKRLPLPENANCSADGHWVNSRRMLVNLPTSALLFDADLGAVTYQFPPGRFDLKTDSLGRGWMSRPGGPGGARVWGPIRVPGADGFKGEVAFGPGKTVRVEIDVGHAEYNKRIAKSTAEYLQKLGMKIGNGGWILRADHQTGDHSMQFSRISGEKFTATFAQVKIMWSLIAPDGTRAWEKEERNNFDPRTTRYVKVGSRRREGGPTSGGFESWQLDYDGKDPRKAQIEEILEMSVLFRGGRPQTLPAVIVKTEKGYTALPLEGKIDEAGKQ